MHKNPHPCTPKPCTCTHLLLPVQVLCHVRPEAIGVADGALVHLIVLLAVLNEWREVRVPRRRLQRLQGCRVVLLADGVFDALASIDEQLGELGRALKGAQSLPMRRGLVKQSTASSLEATKFGVSELYIVAPCRAP